MATIVQAQMRFSRNVNGASDEYIRLPFTAGQTPVLGDLCYRTSNAFTVCGSNPSVITAQAVAAQTEVVPGDPTGTMIWRKIRPGDVFVANIYHSTAASAVLADATITDPLNYNIIKSGGNWYVDVEHTNATRVQIVRRIDAAADVYARVEFTFLAANLSFL